MNTYMGSKTSPSTKTSVKEANKFGSTVLTSWWVIFSVEAVLVIFGNIYAIVFLLRGHFDRVRYFAVSLALTEIIRSLSALVIVFGLLQSDGLSCRVDYQELYLTLQTLCDVFSLCFLAAISLDMYYRTFWPLKHKFTRVRIYMTTNFQIWILSMVITMVYAFALGGFYQLLIANVTVWFVQIINLTIILTNYILIWLNPRCRNSPLWRVKKQNFELSKAFSFCAITYLAIWFPVQTLEGISHFTWNFPCNAIFLIAFLKTFCSFVSPVIYFMKLSRLHKACRCNFRRQKDELIFPPDSLAVITLKSASYLMTAL